ncbi:hypothetical protein QR680_006225 [Steinernema hermaphroditum]|uniref:TIL domain-containing protein n=1 Tax=Steinernema hermaphroditum TaxID=289476 RepID=A0AA39HVX4_9BILA|nr:hypothetical protein QR680_006225 [Steinernema hermaphroditum]
MHLWNVFFVLALVFQPIFTRHLYDRSVEATCGPNEIFRHCATCEGSCDEPDVLCPRFCYDHACHCDFYMGFLRDNDGNCIRREDCRPNAPEVCADVLCPLTQTCVPHVDLCRDSVCEIVPKCIDLIEEEH